MLYSFPSQILFTHISRTAGTSIQASMQTSIHMLKNIGKNQHSPLCEARDELGELFEPSFKFAIVRNPWERLVSWYSFINLISNKFNKNEKPEQKQNSLNKQDFDNYLKQALKETCLIDGKERLAMSQLHQLSDSQENLLTNDIGRFENLNDDFSRLLQKAQLKCPPLKKVNQSNHLHYSRYYSEYGQQLVAESLKEDIDYFGYQFKKLPNK